jgi:small-conductance mechanosensitive channel
MFRTRCLAAALLLWAGPLSAQTDTTAAAERAPVVLRGDTLFWVVTGFGSGTPTDRARLIAQRLELAIDDPLLAGDSLQIGDEDLGTIVYLGTTPLFAVTDAEAAAEGLPRAEIAAHRARATGAALARLSRAARFRDVLRGGALTLVGLAAMVVVILVVNRGFRWVRGRLSALQAARMPAVRIQRLELLSSQRVASTLLLAARLAQIAVIALLVVAFLVLDLSFFPGTRRITNTLARYLLDPLEEVGIGIVGYIPELFFVAVIAAATHFGLRLIRIFFDGIERGAIVVRGFHAEWAEPTFKIVRVFAYGLALVMAFPYLPGSDSDAFKGVSVFFGVVLSLGSAGAIGNIIAGVVITYMRPYRIGDRVKIADTTGDVIEHSLLVTRVRTVKHVEITIPNSMVLGTHITNYTRAAGDGGIILHTSITIGYDAPWRQIHELLIAAAMRTEGLLPKPAPFVLQTALDDFYVRYEINAYTQRAELMARIYSDLHQNIQDEFQRAGVQIMSPNYEADPATPKIPPVYVPRGPKPTG